MAWTNRGKQRMFEEFFEASSVASNFRLQLASATVPVGESAWDSNVSSTSQVVLVSALTVETSGLQVPRDGVAGTGFDVSSWEDLTDVSAARAVLQTANDAYQYSGTITGARYVLLTEEKSTFDAADAEIFAWWDIGSEQNIADGNTLTITALSLQGQ